VWVVTACFLRQLSAGAVRGGSEGHGLLVHVLIEHVDAAVEPEEVVELGHEVAGDGAGRFVSCGVRQPGKVQALLRLRAVVRLPAGVRVLEGGLRECARRRHDEARAGCC
jgi:hypothetical protein